MLNFISIPKYTYRNISNALFPAFLAFGRISKYFHDTNYSPGPAYVDELKSNMLLNSL